MRSARSVGRLQLVARHKTRQRPPGRQHSLYKMQVRGEANVTAKWLTLTLGTSRYHPTRCSAAFCGKLR